MERPGSFNDFMAETGLEWNEAHAQYSELLAEYRASLEKQPEPEDKRRRVTRIKLGGQLIELYDYDL